MNLKTAAALLAGLFALGILAGCGDEGATSGIDPNKNPHYDASKEQSGQKTGSGGFVPDFKPD